MKLELPAVILQNYNEMSRQCSQSASCRSKIGCSVPAANRHFGNEADSQADIAFPVKHHPLAKLLPLIKRDQRVVFSSLLEFYYTGRCSS